MPIPESFPETNTIYGPPNGLEESQCRPILAFRGEIKGGSCDGLPAVVVAYRFTREEAEHLLNGGLLYFTMIGGLAPHYPSLSFRDAIHPA